MKSKFTIIPVLFFTFFSIGVRAESCENCWEPKLNFDIEGRGFASTMIFISGQSYAITMINGELRKENKNNFFCTNKKIISSKKLIQWLNNRLEGVVTAEQITKNISIFLKENYPCE